MVFGGVDGRVRQCKVSAELPPDFPSRAGTLHTSNASPSLFIKDEALSGRAWFINTKSNARRYGARPT